MNNNLQEETLLDKKSKIRRREPITECGLTFYPIMMSDYEKFIACKDTLLLRQATFPVKYMSKSYLSAIWAMETDAIAEGKQSKGIFFRLITLLFLSLRIGMNDKNLIESISCDEKTGELQSIVITQNQKTVNITPTLFSAHIRPLLAVQNGLKLPDETQDPRLVKDAEEKKKSSDKSPALDVNIDDMISSVAYQCKVTEDVIDREWTVREFEAQRRAILRDKNYVKYGQAETSGFVSFKNGNPYPSWEFDTVDSSLGMTELSKTAVGNYASGIQNGGNTPNSK